MVCTCKLHTFPLAEKDALEKKLADQIKRVLLLACYKIEVSIMMYRTELTASKKITAVNWKECFACYTPCKCMPVYIIACMEPHAAVHA